MLQRRMIILGFGLLTMPGIVRASSIMRVKPYDIVLTF